jgi:hypothetical protein
MNHLLRTATVEELQAAAFAESKVADGDLLCRISTQAREVNAARNTQHVEVRVTVLPKTLACTVCGKPVDAGTTGVLYTQPADSGAHLSCHLSRTSKRP